MRQFFAFLSAVCLASLALPAAAADAGWTVQMKRAPAPSQPVALARFGPFEVLEGDRAALVGVTDSASPGHFAAMLKAYPALRVLEMIDCPGTEDDIANLRLGRMIRAAGLETLVPRGGSVRSGAVELFLAGTSRHIEDGTEFAVHAWEDEAGQTPSDYAPSSPENRRYLAYYSEMGMDAWQAEDFYAMTNSAPFEKPRWLTGEEMRKWVGTPTAKPLPRLAYLDLGPALP